MLNSQLEERALIALEGGSSIHVQIELGADTANFYLEACRRFFQEGGISPQVKGSTEHLLVTYTLKSLVDRAFLHVDYIPFPIADCSL